MQRHPETTEIEVTHQLLHAYGKDMLPIRRYLQAEFGPENYRIFRRAARREEYIPEEIKQAVDARMFDQMGKRFQVEWGRELWFDSIGEANETVNNVGGILLPDQDRRASLTVNIAQSTNRPSAALERITKFLSLKGVTNPAWLISEQLKAEQFRQLALAIPCAEEILEDKKDAKEKLTEVNDYLEKRFFVLRSGETKPFHVFSYHQPKTNELIGLSDDYPDSRFPEGLWVKSLSYDVREIGLRDPAGNIEEIVPALYDQREKPFSKRVIKGVYKSKKDINSNGKIEVARNIEDSAGFKLVVMRGGRPMRDRVADELKLRLEEIFGVGNVMPDHDVNPDTGKPDRFPCKRWKAYKEYYVGARPVLEAIVQSLEDDIMSEYHIGKFNPKTGMHDGVGHPFHDLVYAVEVAPDFWPSPIWDIDIPKAATLASYENAGRLARAQRIYPSPYDELI